MQHLMIVMLKGVHLEGLLLDYKFNYNSHYLEIEIRLESVKGELK